MLLGNSLQTLCLNFISSKTAEEKETVFSHAELQAHLNVTQEFPLKS